jgi:hypothetical protein
MPHRAYRMTYTIDLGQDLPLIGPFADLADANHWAKELSTSTNRHTECTVRPVMPPLFACAETLEDEAFDEAEAG